MALFGLTVESSGTEAYAIAGSCHTDSTLLDTIIAVLGLLRAMVENNEKDKIIQLFHVCQALLCHMQHTHDDYIPFLVEFRSEVSVCST